MKVPTLDDLRKKSGSNLYPLPLTDTITKVLTFSDNTVWIYTDSVKVLHPDGSAKSTFSLPGTPLCWHRDADENVYILIDNVIVKHNKQGRQITYAMSVSRVTTAIGFILLTTGKILLYGNNIDLINADGTINTAFRQSLSGIGGTACVVKDAHQYTVDQVIIAGHFDSYNGEITRCLAILNFDGTHEVLFPQGPTEGAFDSVVSDRFGSIYLTGNFNEWNSETMYGIMKLVNILSTIQLDTAWTVKVQDLTHRNTNLKLTLRRHHLYAYYTTVFRFDLKSGVEDFSQNCGAVKEGNTLGTLNTGRIHEIDFQGDKVLVVGRFSSINGQGTPTIARLQSGGFNDSLNWS
jgi:hypothetical protein